MSTLVNDLRTGEEKLYGKLMTLFGAVLWLLLLWWAWVALTSPIAQLKTVTILYIFYGVLIAAFYLIASAVYRANAFGNMVLIGPRQFPELHAMIMDGARKLEMNDVPRVFLFNSHGVVNAHARRLLGGRYVFLTSALVDIENDEEVRFVIGHELGHHAAGHLNPWLHFIRLPAYAVPFLKPAYSRAREYICDRLGAHISNDLGTSRSALRMLGCGCRRLGGTMDNEAFLAQEAMVPPLFGFLTEIFRGHPRLTRRVAAIKARGAAGHSGHAGG